MDPYESASRTNLCVCIGELGERDYSVAYAIFNLIVVILALPVVAFFGMLSNVVNIFVFTRRSRIVCSNSLYLAALAFSDFAVVLTGVFIFCLDSIRVYAPQITTFATKSILWVLPLGYMAQTGSVYFTVGAAFDCYVALCWPGKSFCTIKWAWRYVITVVIFTLAYNTLRFWQFFLHECYYFGELTIEICTTSLYNRINIVYNVYMYMVLMTFLPFILLSILNAFIVRRLHKMKHITKMLRLQPEALIAIMNGKASDFEHAKALTMFPLCLQVSKNGNSCKIKQYESIPNQLTINSRKAKNLTNQCHWNKRTSNSSFDSTAGSSEHEPSATRIVDSSGVMAGADGEETVTTMIVVVILFLACNFLALVINIVETFGETDRLVLNFLSDTSNFLVVFNSSVNFVIYARFDRKFRETFLRRIIRPILKRLRWCCCRFDRDVYL